MNYTIAEKKEILKNTLHYLENTLDYEDEAEEVEKIETAISFTKSNLEDLNETTTQKITITIKTNIGVYVSRKMKSAIRYIATQKLLENSKIVNDKYGSKIQEEEGERWVTILKMDLEVGTIFKVNFNKNEAVEGLDKKSSFYAIVTIDGYACITPSQAVKALEVK